jgi:hypothetical protein
MVIWQPMFLITYVCCDHGSSFFFMMWMLQIWIAQIDRFCIGCNTSSINILSTKVQIHETLNTCSCGVGSGFVLDSVVTSTCGPIGACIKHFIKICNFVFGCHCAKLKFGTPHSTQCF